MISSLFLLLLLLFPGEEDVFALAVDPEGEPKHHLQDQQQDLHDETPILRLLALPQLHLPVLQLLQGLHDLLLLGVDLEPSPQVLLGLLVLFQLGVGVADAVEHLQVVGLDLQHYFALFDAVLVLGQLEEAEGQVFMGGQL